MTTLNTIDKTINANLLNQVCKLMQEAFKNCKGVENPSFTHTAGEIIRLVQGEVNSTPTPEEK